MITKITYRLEYTPQGRTERRVMRSDRRIDIEAAARMLSPDCDPRVIRETTTTTTEETVMDEWRTAPVNEWRNP